MKKILIMLLALSAAFAHAADATPSPAPALKPIASLDVPRHMGTWYEIAQYPNSFQTTCVANTLAEYSARSDGMVPAAYYALLARLASQGFDLKRLELTPQSD